MRVPHSKPLIDQKEIDAVIAVMQRGEIAVGQEIEQFENTVAKYIGKKYAIATSNGTAAIHLSLLSLNIQKGDEVILPASVCPGVIHAIEYTGATPILCDTNVYDLNLSYDSTCKNITDKTKAIILPHLYGIPSDIKSFMSLDIPIIEDCAQSLGGNYKNNMLGSFGALSVFSFYATKMMTSIDGGMILTNDADLANTMKDLRYYAGKEGYKLRYNYKMQNINAAIGLVQLEKFDAFLKERKEIFNFLVKELNGLSGFELITAKEGLSSDYKLLIKFTDEIVKNIYLNMCSNLGISTGTAIFVDLYKFRHGKTNNDMKNLHVHIDNTYSFPIYPGIEKSVLEDFTKQFKEKVGEL